MSKIFPEVSSPIISMPWIAHTASQPRGFALARIFLVHRKRKEQVQVVPGAHFNKILLQPLCFILIQ